MTRAKKGTSKSARLTTKLFIKPKSVKALPAPEPPAFESLSVQKGQCKKAVDALVAHVQGKVAKQSEKDLLAGEENEDVWLTVTLKRMSPKDNPKPIRLSLPHSLLDPRRNPVCLLVKDPQREYKDLLESKKIKFISRVVGMEKLQGKFKPFEARRQLMKEHDLFLVDDRIVPEMPRVLGKSWFQAKKSPIPVTLKRADLKAELERAISSTYLRINKGTSLSIKLGSLSSHSSSDLYDNLLSVIPQLAVRIPLGGFDNIQALNIKTTTSVALPIWNCSLALSGEGEESKAGRFYIPDADEEEIKEKKRLKAEKDERIKEKKQKRLDKAIAREAADLSSGGEDEEDDEEAEDVIAAQLEEIDEDEVETAAAEAPSSAKKPKASKKKTPGSGAEKKTTSSTSKKLKGLESVKGLPRKQKSKAA